MPRPTLLRRPFAARPAAGFARTNPRGERGAPGAPGPQGPPGAGGLPWEGSGIDVTGATDSTAALQAWLQPVREASPVDFWYTPRRAIFLPPGATIRVDNGPIVITQPIICYGFGAVIFCKTATGLCDLLVIEPSARRTIFKEVDFLHAIASVQLQDNDKTAIDVRAAQVSLEDCQIQGAGWGIWNVPEPGGNTNRLFTKNVVVEHCRRAGLTTRGVDASANVHIALDAFVCQNHFDHLNGHGPAIGIEESAAGGSTYIGLKLELTGAPEHSHALLIDPAGGLAPSTFVGVYIEEGDTMSWASNASGRTTVVGGHLALRDETKGDRVGGGNSRLSFRAKDTNGVAYTVQIPGADQFSALWWRSDDSSLDTWLLRRERPNANTYRWVISHYFNGATDLLGVQATFNDPTWAVVPVVAGIV